MSIQTEVAEFWRILSWRGYGRIAYEAQMEKVITAAFIAGFRCCRGYGDNHAHFDGEQRERVIAKYLESAFVGSATEPPK